MPRSSGIPTSRPISGITRIIRSRARSVTVSRPTVQKNSLDGTSETITEHTEQMRLFEPRESIAEEVTGERVNGGLGALVVAESTVDVQKDDRITYGGVEYEVDTIIGHPQDGQPDGTESPETEFYVISFTRRQ